MDVSRTKIGPSPPARTPKAVSVVIPALNEERNIGWVLGRLPDYVDEVIVVDGRSTDRTIEVALAIRPDARIVEEKRPGKGAALRAGLTQARGDHIVMLDADGSMEPGEIGRYLARLEEGFDVVKGSRFLPGGGTTDISRLRVVGNFALLSLANLLYGCRFTELCYGYMAFKKSVIPLLRLTAAGFEIETQIVTHALRAGFRIAEVPSFEAARRFGESNLRTFRDGSRVLHELLRARLGPWPSPAAGDTPASEQPEPLHVPLAAPATLTQLQAGAAGAPAPLAAAELGAASSTTQP